MVGILMDNGFKVIGFYSIFLILLLGLVLIGRNFLLFILYVFFGVFIGWVNVFVFGVIIYLLLLLLILNVLSYFGLWIWFVLLLF